MAARKKLKTEHKTPDNSRNSCNHLIYILPQKIQKARFKILLKAATSKRFNVAEEFSNQVTHVVSDCDHRQQAIHFLKCDEDVWCEDVQIVSTEWLSSCLKDGLVTDVAPELLLKDKQPQQGPVEVEAIPMYVCQRENPLKHHNHIFTDAIEVLAKEADFKNDNHNYSRALAFRNAACSLKSLTAPVRSLEEAKKLGHVGSHAQRVIEDILENGFSSEVQNIENNDWFQTMKLLTPVFGIGPVTADKWYWKGVRSIDDIKQIPNLPNLENERVIAGLAFYEDLTLLVSRKEADVLTELVTREVNRILPGCSVDLTGGFRRGKEKGHDIDLLICPPEGADAQDLLPSLLRRLQAQDLILYGRWEATTFNQTVLRKDTKGQYMQSSLDHFEKWMGILKLKKTFRQTGVLDAASSESVAYSSVDSVDVEQRTRRRGAHLVKTLTVVEAEQAATQDRDWYARRVDLIICPPDQYYYALVGWTGSKQFNRSLRLYAGRNGMQLTSHGLYIKAKNDIAPAASEKAVFENLGIPYQEPENRNA